MIAQTICSDSLCSTASVYRHNVQPPRLNARPLPPTSLPTQTNTEGAHNASDADSFFMQFLAGQRRGEIARLMEIRRADTLAQKLITSTRKHENMIADLPPGTEQIVHF